MDIETGKTYKVTFPKGMHKSDFAKSLSMAKKIHGASYDGGSKTWTIPADWNITVSRLSEMAERGATVEEA